MTEMVRFKGPEGLDSVLEIAPLAIEAMSEIRYVHSASFRLIASAVFTEQEIDAYIAMVTSTDYADALIAAMRTEQLVGARIDGTLVGTAGWSHGDGATPTARLRWVFVRPLFNDCGIGRRLVSETELRVIRAGYESISVRSSINAVEFFEHLGYQVTSRGVQPLSGDTALPVVFMRKTLMNSAISHLTRH